MDYDARNQLMREYITLRDKYKKLSAFLERVEEGSSPIHDDYPVAELYRQQKAMKEYLDTLKVQLEYMGVKTE